MHVLIGEWHVVPNLLTMDAMPFVQVQHTNLMTSDPLLKVVPCWNLFTNKARQDFAIYLWMRQSHDKISIIT